MMGAASGESLSAAARLMERDRRIAAIESGQGLLLESSAPGEYLAFLHGPLLANPARVGLVIVPDDRHPLCRAASASALPVRAMIVTPHMSDGERRDLGIALQNHTVQLLFVTPERLSQPRFVQFIRGLALRFVAVASCQRMACAAVDYLATYEACRSLRDLFPGVPLLGIPDSAMEVAVRQNVAEVLGIALEVEVTEVSPQVPTTSVPPATVPPPLIVVPQPATRPARDSHRPASIPDAVRAAFPLFEREATVAACMDACGRDAAWVYDALAIFIRQTGRTHPFPWVDKPTYLRVSMAAGQAESTDLRLIGSVLGNSVESGPLQMVLAALDNRQESGN